MPRSGSCPRASSTTWRPERLLGVGGPMHEPLAATQTRGTPTEAVEHMARTPAALLPAAAVRALITVAPGGCVDTVPVATRWTRAERRQVDRAASVTGSGSRRKSEEQKRIRCDTSQRIQISRNRHASRNEKDVDQNSTPAHVVATTRNEFRLFSQAVPAAWPSPYAMRALSLQWLHLDWSMIRATDRGHERWCQRGDPAHERGSLWLAHVTSADSVMRSRNP
jgi:hypothetical protein